MAKEALTTAPRELNFYAEGKAESIKRGFAITSLRNPSDRYSFTRGERILANCQNDGEKVPVVVLSNDTRPLSSHEVPVLALDGAFSPEHAADILRPYPTYESTTPDSPMQAIVFVQAEKFDALPQVLQERLLNPENSIMALMKDKELREIFFPTICFWLAEYKGDFSDWTSFLKLSDLVTVEEENWMNQYWLGHHKRRNDAEKFEAYQATTPAYLQSLSLNPNDSFFRPLVLGLPNKREG